MTMEGLLGHLSPSDDAIRAAQVLGIRDLGAITWSSSQAAQVHAHVALFDGGGWPASLGAEERRRPPTFCSPKPSEHSHQASAAEDLQSKVEDIGVIKLNEGAEAEPGVHDEVFKGCSGGRDVHRMS